MKAITIIIALATASTALAQSAYVTTGSTVYTTNAANSRFVTAAAVSTRTAFAPASGARTTNLFASQEPFAFAFFSNAFPSVYLSNMTWIGTPVINFGAIGRPEIDFVNTLGRPEIDFGSGFGPPISPRSLHGMNPKAAKGPAFGRAPVRTARPAARSAFGARTK